jgi:threonine-phosphate decarboxylase
LDQLVDFSASINPLGPSRVALKALSDCVPHLIHYPDPDCHALRETLAGQWGLSPNRFVIGNGSSELIQALPRALGIRRAVIVGPTFSEYERAVALSGGSVTSIDAQRAHGYRPLLGEVSQMIMAGRAGGSRKRIDAVFLCNPNSPTGQAVERTALLELAETASKAGVWLVLDETFIEYCERLSLLPRIARFPRLVILRSFTKFYALPGLRIGYASGSEEAVGMLRAQLPPWSVNSLAQAAAVASIRDRRHARASLAFMERERPRLARSLGALSGVTVFPSSANFLLLELPASLSAADCTGKLAGLGMLVRDCSSVPGLNDRTLRVAVRRSRDNRRLITTLRSLLKRS